MTLSEMSYVYREDALRLRMRITELRQAGRAAESSEAADRFRRRIAELEVLLRQSRELADLTAHYYERNYYRNGKYTV